MRIGRDSKASCCRLQQGNNRAVGKKRRGLIEVAPSKTAGSDAGHAYRRRCRKDRIVTPHNWRASPTSGHAVFLRRVVAGFREKYEPVFVRRPGSQTNRPAVCATFPKDSSTRHRCSNRVLLVILKWRYLAANGECVDLYHSLRRGSIWLDRR